MLDNRRQKQPTSGSRREMHAGTRKCAGCGRRVEAPAVRRELVRIVLIRGADGVFEAHADLGGSGKGRGAWVHAHHDCLARAVARGLAQSAKAQVRADEGGLAQEIAIQAARRAWSLLGTAHRARHLAVGADAVENVERGDVKASSGSRPLLLVARDARAAASSSAVKAALSEGRAMVWADKAQLGAALGRVEVGVVAITDDGIAEAFRHAVSLAETFGLRNEKHDPGEIAGWGEAGLIKS